MIVGNADSANLMIFLSLPHFNVNSVCPLALTRYLTLADLCSPTCNHSTPTTNSSQRLLVIRRSVTRSTKLFAPQSIEPTEQLSTTRSHTISQYGR